MKVFISWSGERSKQLGGAIREWLENVLQFTRPYFTPADMEKGTRWDNEISKELGQSQIGIFVMTREALSSSWIMFEAGAISKVVEKARVCPIVFGIRKTDLVGPLAGFQAIEFNRAEVRQLLTTVNNAANEAALTERRLDEAFNKWWPHLERKVEAISSAAPLPSGPHRQDRELLEEIVENIRSLIRGLTPLPWLRFPPPVHDPEMDAFIQAERRRDNPFARVMAETPPGGILGGTTTSKSE